MINRIAYLAHERWAHAGELDDFLQQARMGLFRAAQDFDPNRGFKFLTYAYWWMRQYCQRYAEQVSSIVRVPKHVHPRPVTLQFVELLSEEGEHALSGEDIIPAREEWEPIADTFLMDLVHRALSYLDQRHRVIIEYRFGLRGQKRTLQEIGDILGITKERVRQLEKKSLARMRSLLCTTDANPRRETA